MLAEERSVLKFIGYVLYAVAAIASIVIPVRLFFF